MLSLLRHVVDESRSRIEGGGASIVTFRFFSMGSRLRGNDGIEAVGVKKAVLVSTAFLLVRPAGRTYLEVKVLYSPDKGKS
jgi:hypothetical protein